MEEGQRGSAQHSEGCEPEKKLKFGQPVRWPEQQVVGYAERDRAQIHEQMPPAESVTEAIGPGAHRRVGNRIHRNGDEHGNAGVSTREAEHLVVVKKQQGAKAEVLDGLGRLAKAIEELHPPADSRCGHAETRYR